MNNNKKQYLVACSGGPDSMALLDMYKNKYDLYVCHINYHKRESAKRDENIVKNYCRKNNIPFIKYDYKDEGKGNFQDKARVFRYKCFVKCVDEYNLEGILVGHHLDDLLETYIMQTQRNSEVSWYGLKKKTTIMGAKIIRPLLKYTKKELEEYCNKNNIAYGIDESNLENHYKRNRIRHSLIEKMSKKEKLELVKEINSKNKEKLKQEKLVKNFIGKNNKFNYEDFINFPYIKKLLRTLIKDDLSDKHLNEIIKAIKSKKNIELKINNKYLFKEYGYIEIVDIEEDYEYRFDALTYGNFKHFKLSKKGTSFEGVTLTNEDFPITVRNVKDGDFIKMRYGTKKINRYFIDHKIPSSQRKIWPIMLNSKADAILVPEIGCNINHYSAKHNLFMIKLS